MIVSIKSPFRETLNHILQLLLSLDTDKWLWQTQLTFVLISKETWGKPTFFSVISKVQLLNRWVA